MSLLNAEGGWLFIFRSSKQLDLYDETFRPIVEAVLEGYNGILRLTSLIMFLKVIT